MEPNVPPSAAPLARTPVLWSLALHLGGVGLALAFVSSPAASVGGGPVPRAQAVSLAPYEPGVAAEEAGEPEAFEQEVAAPLRLEPATLVPEPLEPPDIELSPAAAALEIPPWEVEAAAESIEPPAAPSLLGLHGRRVRPLPAPAEAPAEAPAANPPGPAPGPTPLRALNNPDPTLPAGLRWHGPLVLRLLLLIRADGALGEVRVDLPSGLPALDRHVTAFLARHWRFEPPHAPRWVSQTFRIPAP